MRKIWKNLRCCRKIAIIFTVSCLYFVLSPNISYAYPQLDCVIIDTDAHLDDIRAIAVLAPTKHVVAIVATEGISETVAGAQAIRHFLQRIGREDIPVFPGEAPNPKRSFNLNRDDLQSWRRIAETLNGTFVNVGLPKELGSQNLANDLMSGLDGCHRVDCW